MDDKNKKTLFLTDIGTGLESILQQETNIQPENMLIIQGYSPVISHPYGDIMRSIILAIYQENIEEIFVVGTRDKRNDSTDIQSLLISENKGMKNKLNTVDYLFKNCKPEFFGSSVREWLDVSEDAAESIKKSMEIIRRHPLVPDYIKLHGLVVDKKGELATVHR
ncbi:carbonic anhydrase [Bacillus thermotolerans]|uniref:Carbonic anhydrase n=1 Tax=Bacillus thermotolerans TaxID=1221996 RepID=A0A0F5HRX1_BACTR|nr:carbonic anhydrase [Bacillus thermotolerans]KKB35584.1 Carbonic anhydrase [Bacillus thermotolerans]KKB36109.1 Carbonic anhydrase [Bacillus thermotolerans]